MRLVSTSAAARAGDTDGAINALARPDDFDPRGRFIKRPELSESAWREYESAFTAAFKAALKEAR